jgi:hypothetical protein
LASKCVKQPWPNTWPDTRQPPSQTWRTFLKNHTKDLVSLDFFVVPTITFQLLFTLVILSHDRRRLVHFAVTANPTTAWTARQLLGAFPWDNAPRYLLRDRDRAYGLEFSEMARSMGICRRDRESVHVDSMS